jgi:hypothetical protein
MVWWQQNNNWVVSGEDGSSTAMSDALAGTVGSLPILFAGTSHYVAAVLGVATAVAMVVAEVKRRRQQSLPGSYPLSSQYTQNFNKAVAIAVTVVLSVSSSLLLIFAPWATQVALWTGFAALVGAGSVLPGTYAELVELETNGVYKLYWMPMLFATALFAVMLASHHAN